MINCGVGKCIVRLRLIKVLGRNLHVTAEETDVFFQLLAAVAGMLAEQQSHATCRNPGTLFNDKLNQTEPVDNIFLGYGFNTEK